MHVITLYLAHKKLRGEAGAGGVCRVRLQSRLSFRNLLARSLEGAISPRNARTWTRIRVLSAAFIPMMQNVSVAARTKKKTQAGFFGKEALAAPPFPQAERPVSSLAGDLHRSTPPLLLLLGFACVQKDSPGDFVCTCMCTCVLCVWLDTSSPQP